MNNYEDQWTDKEKTERARRYLAQKRRSLRNPAFETDSLYFSNAMLQIDSEVDELYAAFARACRVHDSTKQGLLEYEPYLKPGYSDDDTPDYPEQWLNHMSEDAAEELVKILYEYGFHKFPEEYDVAELRQKDFIVHLPTCGQCIVMQSPFSTGGLELPDCVNESELE